MYKETTQILRTFSWFCPFNLLACFSALNKSVDQVNQMGKVTQDILIIRTESSDRYTSFNINSRNAKEHFLFDEYKN